jgi:hypothetical protein
MMKMFATSVNLHEPDKPRLRRIPAGLALLFSRDLRVTCLWAT